jgi:NADH-quinone oxidoreductase subunit C
VSPSSSGAEQLTDETSGQVPEESAPESAPATEPAAEPDTPLDTEAEAAPAAPEGEAAEAGELAPQPEAEPEPEGELEPAPLPEEAARLLARLEAELGDAIVEHGHAFGDLVVRVAPSAWRRAAEVARDKLDCDYLSFVAGIDWAPAPRAGGGDEAGGDTSAPVQPTEMTYGVSGSAGRFQVFARVTSTSRHHGVTFKLDVDEDQPRAESWVPVYPGADWHERECWEMFGIAFEGHPSMRHLYLPAEFEGHPLRKDFPLLAREVKPWPGLVDVEPMPGEEASGGEAESPAGASE